MSSTPGVASGNGKGPPVQPLPGEPTGQATVVQTARLYHVDDGTEYLGESQIGVSGLLNRVIEVHNKYFKHYVHVAIQQEMQAGLNSHTSWWARCPKSVIGLPMISPTTKFARAWMIFITLMDLTYAAFWVPMNVAFCSVSYGDLGSRCTIADLAGGIIYMLHLLLNFHMGMVLTHEYKKRLIMEGTSVATLYISHGRFWLDFVSSLPFVYLLGVILGDLGAIRWVAIISLFRLVRMGRLVSLIRTVYMDAQRGEQSSSFIKMVGGSVTAYIIIGSLGLATVVNLEACLLVLVAEFMGEEKSWMVALDWVDIANTPATYQWYAAVFVAIASNTNTGAAGFSFHNQGEMAVFMLMQMVGMIMFTMITTIGLMFMTKVSKYGMTMYHLGIKLKRVRAFLDVHELPDHISKPILTFYFEDWVARSEAVIEDEVAADMPESLRASLLLPVTSRLVKSCHFLSDCSPDLQNLVARALVPVEMMPGVELCQEGQPADCCWIVQQGTVGASNLQGIRTVLEGPCLIGESMIIAREVPGCRERLWSYRVLSGAAPGCPAKIWRLRGREVQMINRATGDFSTSLLLYIQGKLGYNMVPGIKRNAFPGADDRWCESASSILAALRGHSPKVFNTVRLQLTQATLDDSSLPVLLDALLQVSILNHMDAALLGEGLSAPDAVAATRRDMLTRRSVTVMLSTMPSTGLPGGDYSPISAQPSSQWLMPHASQALTATSRLQPQLSRAHSIFSTQTSVGRLMPDARNKQAPHSPSMNQPVVGQAPLSSSMNQPVVGQASGQLIDSTPAAVVAGWSEAGKINAQNSSAMNTMGEAEQASLFSTLLRMNASQFTGPVSRMKQTNPESRLKGSAPNSPQLQQSQQVATITPMSRPTEPGSPVVPHTGMLGAHVSTRDTLQLLAGSSLKQPTAPIFNYTPWGTARLPPPVWAPKAPQHGVNTVPPVREATFFMQTGGSSDVMGQSGAAHQGLGGASSASEFSLVANPTQPGYASVFSTAEFNDGVHKGDTQHVAIATDELSALLASKASISSSEADSQHNTRSSRYSRGSKEQAKQRSMLRQGSAHTRDRVSKGAAKPLWQPASVRRQRTSTPGGDRMLQKAVAALLAEDRAQARRKQAKAVQLQVTADRAEPGNSAGAASSENTVLDSLSLIPHAAGQPAAGQPAAVQPGIELQPDDEPQIALPSLGLASLDVLELQPGVPDVATAVLPVPDRPDVVPIAGPLSPPEAEEAAAARVISHALSGKSETLGSLTGESVAVGEPPGRVQISPFEFGNAAADEQVSTPSALQRAASAMLVTADFSIPMPPKQSALASGSRKQRAHRSCEFIDEDQIRFLESALSKSERLAKVQEGALPERKSIRIAEHPEILGEDSPGTSRGLQRMASNASTDGGARSPMRKTALSTALSRGALSRAASVEGLSMLPGSSLSSSRRLSRAASGVDKLSNLARSESNVSGKLSQLAKSDSGLSTPCDGGSQTSLSKLGQLQGCIVCDGVLVDEGPPCVVCGAGYCWECGGFLAAPGAGEPLDRVLIVGPSTNSRK